MFDVLRQILVTACGAVILFFLTVFVFGGRPITYRKWRKAVRLFGWRATLRAAGRTALLRFRQPLRAILSTSPGPTSIVFGVLAVLCYLSWSGSWLDLRPEFAVLFALIAVSHPILSMTPPAVFFLGLSDYEQFCRMKELQRTGDLMVLALIDQASQGVLKNYRQHYAPRKGERGFAERVVDWYAPYANPQAPRYDSLRTRPRLWRQTFRDAVDLAPIVVLDARDFSRYVLEETLWMLAPERANKCVFLINDDGTSPIMDRVLALGVKPEATACWFVKPDELAPLILKLTESPESLATATTPESEPETQSTSAISKAQEDFATVVELTKTLQGWTGAAAGADRELDAAIWAYDHGSQPPPDGDLPRYTASIDTALDLAQRHLAREGAKCSYTINVNIGGDGNASIGVQTRPGNMRVFNSMTDGLGPARALLQAFFGVELS